MAAPNVFNASSIIQNYAGQACQITPNAIVTNAAASGKVYVIKSLYVANVAASAGTLTVDKLDASSVVRRIVNVLPVPINSTAIVIATDAPVYLLENESIRITVDATSKFEANCSWDEIS